MDLDIKDAAPEQAVDLLSEAWCRSAIQVLQPPMINMNCGSKFVYDDRNTASLKSKRSLKLDESDTTSKPQWKVDDLKSWLWIQQAIHPEVNYELPSRKRLFSAKTRRKGIFSIKGWLKEWKQEQKEQQRLQRAEVHAAISVAGVAAALAAIAAENSSPNKTRPSKDVAVATAAAIVAAQCARAAESVGADPEKLASAIDAAAAATDASNIITLAAAAATSLKGAATLRQRPAQRDKGKSTINTLPFNEFDFDFRKGIASLAKGDEFLMETPKGWKSRWVSIILHKQAKVVLRTKKINALMVFTKAKESIIYDLDTISPEEHMEDRDMAYFIVIGTSQGKMKLKIKDYGHYRTWVLTINHMLMLSTTFAKY